MTPTLHAAAAEIRAGRLSPVDLLDACLERVERLESRVRAWVFLDREQARADAERLHAELRRGQYRGPLHGIPVAVKDIFDVFDWPTAAGSRLWTKSVARQDSAAVRRLREAGAVFPGKTVTTQYASFDPPVTRNPWDPERTPGGSSSGSAAAVACGMCPAALASQTGGSITRPASYCGVAGVKATFGRVSTVGVLPLAPSLDHIGAMARCVRDLALLLQVLAGPDPQDPLCAARPVPDYLAALSRPPAAPRLGRVGGLFEERAEPEVRSLMDDVSAALGGHVREVALPAAFADVVPRHRTVMAVESAAYHEPRLRRHPDDYEPRVRGLLEEGLATPAPEYARCKEHQRRLTEETVACLTDVDALLAPATTGAAPAADTTGDPAFQAPWSYTGLPTVSILAGWTAAGLPLCVQLVGRPWGEAELLAVAAWCEARLAVEERDPAEG
jgi:aspartyl-tRNA(Asn)/glutamyl-tRNA(Gln) amidotransferase subunit A